MAQQSRKILKLYFQEGRISSKRNFIDLLDSFADIPPNRHINLTFAAKRSVIYESNQATLCWHSQGVELLCLEYIKEGVRVSIKDLPSWSDEYIISAINETCCFQLSGICNAETVSQQVWVYVIPDTEPERLVKHCFADRMEIVPAAQNVLKSYPQLKPLLLAVAFVKAGYLESDLLRDLRNIYPKITPLETAEVIEKLRKL